MELQYKMLIDFSLLSKREKDHLITKGAKTREGQESESDESEAEEQLGESTVNTSESINCTDASTTTSIPSKQATTFL